MGDNYDWAFAANLVGLDLNEDPETLLERLDSAQQRVEARIRQLEADEERRRQEQNQTSPFPGPTGASVNNDQSSLQVHGTNHMGMEMNSDVSRADQDRASFYNCSICLEMATDPILTCCGHLFCWPCFYQVPNINSTYKECPVCRGEVSENTITPIYGNGGESQHVVETESGLRIPPRPRAHRAESFRQMVARNDVHENGDNPSSPWVISSGRVYVWIGELLTATNSQELRGDVQAPLRGRRRRNTGPGEEGRGAGDSRRRRPN